MKKNKFFSVCILALALCSSLNATTTQSLWKTYKKPLLGYCGLAALGAASVIHCATKNKLRYGYAGINRSIIQDEMTAISLTFVAALLFNEVLFAPTSPAAQPVVAAVEPGITLADIQGKLPQEIYDLCSFIGQDTDFINAGAKPPKGILLQGPPGTGKTTIARALAGSLNIPFIDGGSAASFINQFMGTGPATVRGLFEQAEAALARTKANHVIIFIDEIDAIGDRSKISPYSSQEYANTINELLVQMDGFSSDPRIIIIAATNHAEKMDAALKRRGRFDYIITIPLPDAESRAAILAYYLGAERFKRTIDADVDAEFVLSIAQQAEGFSGADLEGLADDAALEAGRNKRISISQNDLEAALIKARNR